MMDRNLRFNPAKKQSTMVSLDRDIYTQIVGYGMLDKLNHAYAFGGEAMSMDSVENLLRHSWTIMLRLTCKVCEI